METKIGKIRVAKTKRREGKRRGRKKTRGKGREKTEKTKKEKTIEVKRAAEEWEIWDKKEEAAKSEAEVKKLVPEKFHKWIKVFGKK